MHGNELREWSTGEGLGVLRPWELREWSALWVFTDAAPAPAGVGGFHACAMQTHDRCKYPATVIAGATGLWVVWLVTCTTMDLCCRGRIPWVP